LSTTALAVSRLDAESPAAALDLETVVWHIVTGEYPPQPGGVSDYTEMVAEGLAQAGDRVVVWAPAQDEAAPAQRGVEVRRLPGKFGPRSLLQLSRALAAEQGVQRILVQYVPHAFGWKAANVLFCAWLRSRPRGSVWVMFHEVAYPFERDDTLRRKALALVNRLMARLVGGAAGRAFVSIPAWQPLVDTATGGTVPVTWLPVPSAIPVVNEPRARAAVRDRYAPGRPLVGHFGTYSAPIRAALEQVVPDLIARVDCSVVLLGRASDAVAARLVSERPALEGRLFATGALSPAEVSKHVGACDLMLQPYPDGISSRRTSAMAALSHAKAMVTTLGPLSEPLWRDSGAAVFVPADEIGSLADAAASLLESAPRRDALGARAAALYREKFDVAHTIAALRGPAGLAGRA
jgi:glycosyltransferase involved in cell wall biosynthesis